MVVEQTPEEAGEDEKTDSVAAELTAARLYVAAIERGEHISGGTALVMLVKMAQLHQNLDDIERVLTEHVLNQGYSWSDVAERTGRTSRQAAHQRYTRLQEAKQTSDLSTKVKHLPQKVKHLPQKVKHLPQSVPVDITPNELLVETIVRDGAPTWAEPAATPAEVTDWPERQANAWVPFERDEYGWPINPVRHTGYIGRNLPRWGENTAADALVFSGHGEHRKVLLIQRGDAGTWTLPGGMLDPGGTAEQVMIRELWEGTGLDLTGIAPERVWSSYVEDRRASDHAWIVTTIGVYVVDESTEITVEDNTAAAAWWPAATIQDLDISLNEADGQQLHSPHSLFIVTEMDRRREH